MWTQDDAEEEKKFKDCLDYFQGGYDEESKFADLDKALAVRLLLTFLRSLLSRCCSRRSFFITFSSPFAGHSQAREAPGADRLFFLSVPPTVFVRRKHKQLSACLCFSGSILRGCLR